MLIGEDSDDLREAYQAAFESRDYIVRMACDGTQVLARLDEAAPDLLLLDFEMPGATGLEVLAWVRTHPVMSRLKVILVTGSAYVTETPEAQQADLCLVKPVRLKDLTELASRLLSL